MFNPSIPLLSVALLLLPDTAFANAEITAAAQLAPRATDPAFVGYISENGGYSDPRFCDYPQTLSTSGAYAQCCPASGACPFYTSCSSNTLLAASATVPCDINPALACNTAIVLPLVGASGGASYLACWQTNLGNSPFTFVQNIGSAAAAGSASTSAAVSGNTARSSSAASRTSSSETSSVASAMNAASSTASASRNSANPSEGDSGFGSGILGGAIAFLVQALL